MKLPKPDAKSSLVSELRKLACELHSLASNIEQCGNLDKVESKLRDMPETLAVLKQCAKLTQESQFDKAIELVDDINASIALEKLAQIELEQLIG